MSQVANTRKVFKFAIEIDGVNQFLIQKVTPPDKELGVVEHGSSATEGNTKTPGKLKIGNLVVEKLKHSDKADPWAHNWIDDAVKGTRSRYAKYAVLHELGEDGETPVASYDCGEIWPFKVSSSPLDRKGEDNIIETVSFAVDRYTLRK